MQQQRGEGGAAVDGNPSWHQWTNGLLDEFHKLPKNYGVGPDGVPDEFLRAGGIGYARLLASHVWLAAETGTIA